MGWHEVLEFGGGAWEVAAEGDDGNEREREKGSEKCMRERERERERD